MFLNTLINIISNLFYLALHVKGAGAFPPPLSAKREAELLEKNYNKHSAKNSIKVLQKELVNSKKVKRKDKPYCLVVYGYLQKMSKML